LAPNVISRIKSLNETIINNISIEELESRLASEEANVRTEMWTGCGDCPTQWCPAQCPSNFLGCPTQICTKSCAPICSTYVI
jgi:hypothetical protein